MLRLGGPDQRDDGIPPLRVFLGLIALFVAVGAVVLLTREDEPNPPPPATASTSPNFALTDKEAIQRFKELRHLRDQMYRQRDQSLISEIYASGPSKAVALRELRRLGRDDVFDRSSYRTRRIEIEVNTPERIRITEKITLFPRFLTAEGVDVTRGTSPLNQTATWVLVVDHGQWLVYESILEKSEKRRA